MESNQGQAAQHLNKLQYEALGQGDDERTAKGDSEHVTMMYAEGRRGSFGQ